MNKTANLEITAEERGLLLRTLQWLITKQTELPFNSLPSDYWSATALAERLQSLEL